MRIQKNIMENACMSAKGIIFQNEIHDLLLSKIVYLRDIIIYTRTSLDLKALYNIYTYMYVHTVQFTP